MVEMFLRVGSDILTPKTNKTKIVSEPVQEELRLTRMHMGEYVMIDTCRINQSSLSLSSTQIGKSGKCSGKV